MLWAGVFDVSTPTFWLSAAMALVAFALGLSMPGHLVRAVQRVLSWVHPRAMVPIPLVGSSSAESPVHLSRLLGVASIVASGAAIASAMLLLLTGWLANRVAGQFILRPPSYRVLQAVLQLLAMLMWGLGAAVMWQSHSLLRGRSGEDPSWRTHDDWLWGLVLACGATALAWRMAWDLLGVALAAAGVQVAVGLALIRWPRGGPPVSQAGATPTSGPPARRCIALLVLVAAAAAAGVLQLRALVDLLGGSMSAQAVFAGASVACFAIAHRGKTLSAKSAVPLAAPGALIVAVVVLSLQASIGWVSLTGGPVAHGLLYAALAGQVPMAVSLAVLVVDRRRKFIAAGGRARRWFQWMLVGVAVGAIAGSLVLGNPIGTMICLSALLAGLAGAILVGIARSGRTGNQLIWACAGGALMLSITVCLTQALRRPIERAGLSVSTGQWLTAFQRGHQSGYLPLPASRNPWKLDLLAGELLLQARSADGIHSPSPSEPAEPTLGQFVPAGKWLLVLRRPVLVDAPSGVYLDMIAADPAVLNLPAWTGRGQPTGVLTVLRTELLRYNGILYAPIRADHPQSRALFAEGALRQLAYRLADRGLLLLHVPCFGADVAPMLAVARTAREVLGDYAVVARINDDSAELLLCIPTNHPDAPADKVAQALRSMLGDRAAVLTADDLAPLWSDVPAVRGLAGPTCGEGGSASRTSLADLIRTRSSATGPPASP